MVARTPRLTVLAVLCAAVAVMLTCWSAAALAVQTHPFVKTFGGAAGVSGANGIAIAPGSGEVYVSDPGNNVVEKFNPVTGALDSSFGDTPIATDGRLAGRATAAGEFAGTQGLAVDPASGDLYVTDVGHGVVAKFTAAGVLVSAFGTAGEIGTNSIPSGSSGSIDTGNPFLTVAVAVDPNNGDVYAADLVNSTVDKFSAAGAFISQIDVSATVPGPVGLAVDAAGNLYVVGSGSVEEFDSSGTDLGPLDQSGSDQGVSVDPASGDVYVAQGSRIAEFSGGSQIGSFGQVGEPRLQNADAVAIDAAGHPFVADNGAPESEKAIFEFGTPITTTAPSAVESPVAAVTATTAHFAGTVNPNGFDTGWHFEYSTDHVSWASVPSPDHDAGSGTSAVGVSADPTELQPASHYFTRLVASNGLDPVAVSAEQSFTTPAVAPTVGNDAPIFDLTATSVTLRADVNPYNATLSVCHFDYGTSNAYGAQTPCGQTPTGHDPVTVSAEVSGLQPGRTYHFRLDAGSVGGSVSGPDASFTTPDPQSASCPNAPLRTGLSAGLPDCRAYEQVSPIDKNGSDVLVNSSRAHVAADGSRVIFPSLGGFADVHGTGVATDYMAERESSGWSSHNIYPTTPPLDFNVIASYMPQLYKQTTSDLTAGIYSSPYALTDDPATNEVGNLYLRGNLSEPGTGAYQLLTSCPACEAPGGVPLLAPDLAHDYLSFDFFAGASADLRHVIFESRQNLTDDVPAGDCSTSGAYETECPIKLYESFEGTVKLVGILPNGNPASGSVAGQGTEGSENWPVPHAISEDGARVIFTDSPHAQLGAQGNLYMRINGSSTVQINASERTDCADHQPCSGTPEPDPNGSQPAKYWDASADGTRVFFSTGEALTDERSNIDGGGIQKLYMYDADASAGHHLSLIVANPVEGGEFEGFIGSSSNGQYVYFEWGRTILPGQARVRSAMYVWHDGEVKLVAPTVDPLIDDVNSRANGVQGLGRQSRVTPDGLHLLFGTEDVVGPTGDTQNHNEELYLYSASNNHLSCVSCGAGETQTSATSVDEKQGASIGAIYPININTPNSNVLPHALSDDGRYVFFTTAAKLVPQDVNGVDDAYEYDSQTGQVHLLSTGSDPQASFFMDASSDGSDAVIATRQQLVGQDRDQLMDVYDARVDGGIAAQNPATNPPPCADTTSCHGVLPSQPGGVSPTSTSFNGPGNLTPPQGPTGVRPLRVSGKGGKQSLSLTVSAPGAGHLLVTGTAIKRRSVAIVKAGSYRLSVSLSTAVKRELKRGHRVKVKVRVGYVAAVGASSATSITLTVKA
jgi:hypothetical protein